MFLLSPVVFLISLEEKGHTIPHWKALISIEYEPRVLRCSSTLNISQNVLKSASLLHKLRFVGSQMKTTVICSIFTLNEQNRKSGITTNFYFIAGNLDIFIKTSVYKSFTIYSRYTSQ